MCTDENSIEVADCIDKPKVNSPFDGSGNITVKSDGNNEQEEKIPGVEGLDKIKTEESSEKTDSNKEDICSNSANMGSLFELDLSDDEETKVVDEETKVVDEETKVVDEETKVVDEETKVVDEDISSENISKDPLLNTAVNNDDLDAAVRGEISNSYSINNIPKDICENAMQSEKVTSEQNLDSRTNNSSPKALPGSTSDSGKAINKSFLPGFLKKCKPTRLKFGSSKQKHKI